MIKTQGDHPNDVKTILASARQGAVEFVDSFVRLAHIEVQRDIRKVIALAAQGLVYLALLLAGYCFFVIGAGLLLSAWLPAWTIFLSLGIAHVAAAALGASALKQRAQNLSLLPLTTVELRRAVSSLKGGFPGSSASLVPVASGGAEQPPARM